MTKTPVFETSPEPAVTAPETVNVPEPVTDCGATLTVTESAAAVAVSGAAVSSKRSAQAKIAERRDPLTVL